MEREKEVRVLTVQNSTIWYISLIYAAVGLYNTHSLNGVFSPKVPMYKNSKSVCIPSPKYCLYTHVSKFMKQ